MAGAIRNCLGVDLGSHSIRVAYLEMGKAGPRVLNLLEEPIKVEAAGQSEAQRQQAIARQLQEMLKKAKIRTKYAVFCIPGQSVFVKRPPKLPRTTPERLDRIIRFEARQQIPFPLDKTIMEYQVFEEGDPNEVSVLLAAIKRDYITTFMKMIKRTGLSPLAISVSSLALYNFHELNSSARNLLTAAAKEKPAKEKANGKGKEKEPEKTKEAAPAKEKKSLFSFGKKKTAAAPDKAAATAAPEAAEEVPLEEMGFEDVRAYVNLGASLMDLAIAKPGPARLIGFTRSVPLAGAEMDRAIRTKLELGSIEEARKIKETETAILSTEFEVEGDSESVNMEASEAATAVADRIISELRRSLDYYISQPDGVAVDAIMLSGGLARMPYLRSYIEEKMGLPVELTDVKHHQLRLPDARPEPFCPFVVATGLALQGLGLAQNAINFLPEEVKTIQAVRNKPFEMIGMVGMLFAIIGLSFNVGAVYSQKWRADVDSMKDNFQKYQVQSGKIAAAEGRNAKVGDCYTKLSKAAGWRDYWFSVLRYAVLERRPPDVVLDEIQLRLDGVLIIQGKSPSYASILAFMDNLGKVPYYIFSNGTKASIGWFKPPYKEVPDPRFTQPVFEFGLMARTPIRRPRIKTFGDQPGYTPPIRPGGGFPGQPGMPFGPGGGPR